MGIKLKQKNKMQKIKKKILNLKIKEIIFKRIEYIIQAKEYLELLDKIHPYIISSQNNSIPVDLVNYLIEIFSCFNVK